jgi:hypothetical protein
MLLDCRLLYGIVYLTGSTMAMEGVATTIELGIQNNTQRINSTLTTSHYDIPKKIIETVACEHAICMARYTR